MQLLFIIPSFLVFLFCIYKLVKDDYVFIRKSISLEHMFDIIFGVVWIALFTSRIAYFLLYPIDGVSLFSSFFSIRTGGFSLMGGVVGGLLGLYLIAKYKKMPLGRLFDVVSLAFLIALPFGFGISAFGYQGEQMYLLLGQALLYLFFMMLFMRLLYPKLMSRNLREGTISLYFFLLFFCASLGASVIEQMLLRQTLATAENIILVSVFIAACALLFKQENARKSRRIN